MSNHDPADTVRSATAVTMVSRDGASKTPKVVRKRPTRTPVVQVVEPPVPVTVVGEQSCVPDDLEGTDKHAEPGLGTPGPTGIKSRTSPASVTEARSQIPAPEFLGLSSAIPSDERDLEAILNGLVPVRYARRRESEGRDFRLPELERPTLALRQGTMISPAPAVTSEWARLQPPASPSHNPVVVRSTRRLAWRRTP